MLRMPPSRVHEEKTVADAKDAFSKDYTALTGQDLVAADLDLAMTDCLLGIKQIGPLAPLCDEKTFMEIDIDACLDALTAVEGGPMREQLQACIRKREDLAKRSQDAPDDAKRLKLTSLIARREKVESETAGDVMHVLFKAGIEALEPPEWSELGRCPLCENESPHDLKAHFNAKLDDFAALEEATQAALINEGLLPLENDPPRRCIAFDRDAGEIVARKVKASVSLEGVGDYLGCEPVVARAVEIEGFAERAFSEHFNMVGRAPKVLHRLTTASLDDFLSALFCRAKSVDAFHPNVLPLVRAAKSENWPVGSVIKLVLAKKLAVYRLLNGQDFGSLLIGPSDLHCILHAPPSSAHISKRDAARQLGVEQMTISRLVNTSDENGRPFLRRVLISLNRNQKQQNVCRDDLEAFDKTHISLGKHAKDKAMGVGELFTQLKSCEIHPFPFATTKNDQFYRRSGL
jgi:hypothetical protein